MAELAKKRLIAHSCTEDTIVSSPRKTRISKVIFDANGHLGAEYASPLSAVSYSPGIPSFRFVRIILIIVSLESYGIDQLLSIGARTANTDRR